MKAKTSDESVRNADQKVLECFILGNRPVCCLQAAKMLDLNYILIGNTATIGPL